MNRNPLGLISLFCLVVTLLWIVLMLFGVATAGPVETLEQALAAATRYNLLFVLTYLNATLITLSATMLFAALYVGCRLTAPDWAAIGVIFVPVYCALNLFAYLSQITIVPRLVASGAAATGLLSQMLQQSPGSVVSIVNNLAYAVLGIPSIIFGLILFRRIPSLCLAGALLALSGLASIVGMAGIVLRTTLLENGSLVGGVLFLLALIPLSVRLLRGEGGY
jgi:hypothetical protein